MSQRSAFQVQILSRLGAPLMTAVGEVAARQRKDGEDTQKQEAERLAELLGKAVQVSVSLAGIMDLKDSDGQADSTRLALAALAGPLVAGQYRLTAKVPGDAEIKRMIKALEAVLTFSDNFTPAAENTARLASMAPGALADENQIHIQYVNALVPVVNVIAAFPFGRPETRLVQEVAGQLVGRAQDICKSFMNGAAEKDMKQAELAILAALAALYVECHQEEKNRLMALGEQARAKTAEASGGVLPVDPVWKAFEIRAGMVELLAKSAVSAASSAAKAPAPPQVAAPVVAPSAPPPPPPPVAAAPAPAAPLPSPTPEDLQSGDPVSYNPMGFFKPVKKDSAGEQGES